MASSTTIAAGNTAGTAALSRLRCWGDFAITDPFSGADLRPRGRKTRALLAYLALHAGKPISRERLTGLLWGDRAEEQARASLRQSIFELRPFTNGPRSLLTVKRDHLVLDPAALVTDIDELRDSAQRGDLELLLHTLPDRDDQLFANLDDVDPGFDDWLTIERAHQREALVALIADAAAVASARGQTREARALNIRLVELDPDRETALAPAQQAGSDGTQLAPPSPANAPDPGQRWGIAILVALLLTFSVLAIGAWQFQRSQAPPPTTIAVLPFKDLSSRDNAYFAEGVAEEILGQLARNPRLKVMGRTSAWSFKDQPLDAPALGRKLDVAYLVEGSVRTAGPNVRVNISLVRASDGAQLWSERYDGPLDDMFAIQDKIGAAVAGRLDSGNAGQPAVRAIATRGDVYSLYLTARGLMRERKPAQMGAAVDLLRQAVKLDPRFAPAWARLGGAVKMHGNFLNELADGNSTKHSQEAERYVRRALALQPDLAEAHATLGMVLDFKTPEAGAHIKRAVRLNPNDAEILFWLGNVYGEDGDYSRQLNALRRSVAIDPLWHRGAIAAAVAAWEMGFRDEARRYAQRAERGDPRLALYMNVEMARSQGDYSRIVKDVIAARPTLEDASGAEAYAGFALLTLGHSGPSRLFLRLPPDFSQLTSGGSPPAAEGVVRIYRDQSFDFFDTYFLPLLLRQLLNSGRAAEIVGLYDSSEGPLGRLASDSPKDRIALVELGPTTALALRAVARGSEASRLLARADAEIRRSLALGRVPNWFHALAAETWSAQGRRDEALAALQAAANGGWHFVSMAPGPDIADIPAFRALRGDPRFERVRTRLRALIERERRELGPVVI